MSIQLYHKFNHCKNNRKLERLSKKSCDLISVRSAKTTALNYKN